MPQMLLMRLQKAIEAGVDLYAPKAAAAARQMADGETILTAARDELDGGFVSTALGVMFGGCVVNDSSDGTA